MRARSESCAPQSTNARPGRRRAAWRRAGPSRRCPSARRACRRPARAPARRRRGARQRDRRRGGLDLDLDLRAPRHVRAQVALDGVHRAHGVGARRDAHGDLGARVRDHDVARALDGGRVEAEDGDRVARPHAVADVAGADQLRRRRARRPGGGSRPRATPRRPSRRPASPSTATLPSSSWSVAIRRVSASSASGAAPPKWPLCRAPLERAQRHGELAVAAQRLRQRRLPHLPVAVVGDHHHVGAHQLGLARRRPRAAPGARSPPSPRSSTFTCTGGLPSERAQRGRGGRRCRTCRRRRRGRRRGRPCSVGANGSVSHPSGGAGWTS